MKQAAVFLLALALLGAGCLRTTIGELRGANKNVLPPASTYTFEDVLLPEDETATSTEPLPVPPEDPNVQQGEIASDSRNVIVSSVVPGTELQNPFVILGRARAFESVVNWRIADSRRKELASGRVMTSAPDVGRFGAFRVRAFLNDLPGTSGGSIEVFTLSPRDGSEQDMVSIPVRFSKHVVPLKVYFSNIVKDPGAENCAKVYPVTRRVYQTQGTAEASLLELLKGPSALERGEGSRTSILPGTVLRSVVLSNGMLTADFSRDLAFALAGSCNIQALRSQIEQTMRQFPTVQSVKLLIEGESFDALYNP